MADNAVTLGGIYKLPKETTAEHGFTHAAVVKYTDINAAGGQGDTVTVTLGTTPAKYVVDRAQLHVSTAFAYASGSATLTVMAGPSSDTDGLVQAVDALTAGHKLGVVALTDSSTGTASNTLAAITSTEPGDLAAVGVQLGVIKNAVASLAAKVNGLVKYSPIITGTSAATLQMVFTCQNTTGGDPTNISAGECVLLLRIIDLNNAY